MRPGRDKFTNERLEGGRASLCSKLSTSNPSVCCKAPGSSTTHGRLMDDARLSDPLPPLTSSRRVLPHSLRYTVSVSPRCLICRHPLRHQHPRDRRRFPLPHGRRGYEKERIGAASPSGIFEEHVLIHRVSPRRRFPPRVPTYKIVLGLDVPSARSIVGAFRKRSSLPPLNDNVTKRRWSRKFELAKKRQKRQAWQPSLPLPVLRMCHSVLTMQRKIFQEKR